MIKRAIDIGGMTCGHCVSRVGNALEAIPGIRVEEVKVGSATVEFDEATTDESVIGKAIKTAGFTVLLTG
jgi:copper chaperone CopZ